MAYKYGNREQVTFLPESIETYVSEADPVRAYDAFVDALNFEKLGIVIDSNAVGNSAYDPVVMLKILIYSYSYGWQSSRKIERALHHNLSFIWLAGGLKPDHKTISNFRKNNKGLLKNTLKQCAQICFKLKLIEGNILFVDGSKVRANAGNRQTKRKRKWIEIEAHLDKKIDTLLKETQVVDETETENLVELNKELQSKERLKHKIQSLINDIDDENKLINGTDSDCKVMKGRQGSHASFNCQSVVDDKNGLIVSIDVNSSANDFNQMTTQIIKAEETLEKESDVNCADAGYSSINDLKNLVEKGRMVIVPNPKQVARNQKDEPFSKDKFLYDLADDSYTCPEGNILRKTYRKTKYQVYRIPNKNICKTCKHYMICTKSKTGRSIDRLPHEETKDHLAKNYESVFGQEIYSRRKLKVELPFGHIKHNLGVSNFLMRGFSGAKAEFSILASCFNIARMLTILGGVTSFITRMKEIS